MRVEFTEVYTGPILYCTTSLEDRAGPVNLDKMQVRFAGVVVVSVFDVLVRVVNVRVLVVLVFVVDVIVVVVLVVVVTDVVVVVFDVVVNVVVLTVVDVDVIGLQRECRWEISSCIVSFEQLPQTKSVTLFPRKTTSSFTPQVDQLLQLG
jgi:hypothetical protein